MNSADSSVPALPALTVRAGQLASLDACRAPWLMTKSTLRRIHPASIAWRVCLGLVILGALV